MIKVDIFSGFLGSGKTTLISKLLKEAYKNEKVVLIENEFGEIGVDGGFLKEAGVEITEMNSGCICCSLSGDFSEALKKVKEQFNPDRILIEPSGVGKLSDVIHAVENVHDENMHVNALVCVADVKKVKMYMKNFGEFYNDQIVSAKTILLSRTQLVNEEKTHEAMKQIHEMNPQASFITTPWDELSGEQILTVMEKAMNFAEETLHEHHHDHEECECGHEHHHDHEECECGHEHHHDHEKCECGCDHHHHHADDVFISWGVETVKHYDEACLHDILHELSESDEYGTILRAKGIVQSLDNEWLYFDVVPNEVQMRKGKPETCGKLCVIGSKLKEDELNKLFQLGE